MHFYTTSTDYWTNKKYRKIDFLLFLHLQLHSPLNFVLFLCFLFLFKKATKNNFKKTRKKTVESKLSNDFVEWKKYFRITILCGTVWTHWLQLFIRIQKSIGTIFIISSDIARIYHPRIYHYRFGIPSDFPDSLKINLEVRT